MRANLRLMQRGSEASYTQAVVIAFIAACVVPFGYEVWSYLSYLMRFRGRCTEWLDSVDCSFMRYALPTTWRMSLGFAALEHLALGAITFALVMSVGLVLVWRVRRKARKGLRFERSAK